MKTKEELIQEYINSPLKATDKVVIYQNKYSSNYLSLEHINKDKTESGNATIVSVNEDNTIDVLFYQEKTPTKILPEFIKEKDVMDVGANPFTKQDWNSNVRFLNFALESILNIAGFEEKRTTEILGKKISKLDWNPIIKNKEGKEIEFQRDFVWTLKDKQLLIDSIYNNIEIGKIITRKRSWEYLENRIKEGHTTHLAFHDVIDGKQRLNAILGFVNNEFVDSHGNHFQDLSERSQRKFFSFMSLTYGEIEENATDEQVQKIFVNINFAGVQMSQEHINFVKSLNI